MTCLNNKNDDIIVTNDVNGKIMYNITDNALFFVNKNKNKTNICKSDKVISKRTIQKQVDYKEFIKYCGIWSDNCEYKINTLVKYNKQIYLSKNDVDENQITPDRSSEWELFIEKNITDIDNEILFLNIKSDLIDKIERMIYPLSFYDNKKLPKYVEYIEISNSYYLIKSANYNVVYNITYNTNVEYFKVLFFIFDDIDTKPKIINNGTSYCDGGDNTKNINHNFILSIKYDDDHVNNTKSEFKIETSYKIVLSIKFDESDFEKFFNINNEESWLNIHII